MYNNKKIAHENNFLIVRLCYLYHILHLRTRFFDFFRLVNVLIKMQHSKLREMNVIHMYMENLNFN
jgi:hypothetical protein